MTSSPIADTVASKLAFGIRAATRSHLRRLAKAQASPPSAFDRWVARPAVFITAIPIGLAIIVATLNVTRDAPLYRQLTVMLVQLGLVMLTSLAVNWWKNRSGRGEG